jgi:protein TonB
MTPIAAKLASSARSISARSMGAPSIGASSLADIARPRVDETSAASSLPVVAIVSVALHVGMGLALVLLPMPASVAPMLEMTWIELDEPIMPAAAPEVIQPEVVPPAPIPPPPVVRHERPQPVAAVEPEIAPPAPELAPPSVDDVFGEPPPPAAILTGEGATPFAMPAGELGGTPGGTLGGHGTQLVSTVRPAPQETGPSEADRRRARRGYVHAIEELVRGHARYPRAAARDGLQGRVELGLRIGADGRVLAIRIASSSGSAILDDAATSAAREIDRVPAPPAIAALTSSDEVRVGVVYMVR